MEQTQVKERKVVHPVIQIAQAVVDDVAKRGEVAELLYGTEKVRFARALVRSHAMLQDLLFEARAFNEHESRYVEIKRATFDDVAAFLDTLN